MKLLALGISNVPILLTPQVAKYRLWLDSDRLSLSRALTASRLLPRYLYYVPCNVIYILQLNVMFHYSREPSREPGSCGASFQEVA